MTKLFIHGWRSICLILLFWGCSGCVSLDGIPPTRVPAEFLALSRDQMQKTTLTRLRQDVPPEYLLAPEDTVGVYIQDVIGKDEADVPVNSSKDDRRPPTVGYPFTVSQEGTIRLPLVRPVFVQGLTLDQAAERIRDTYLKAQILKEDKDRILISLLRPRTYRVMVVRQEEGFASVQTQRGTFVSSAAGKTSRGYLVDLEAFENDVLHALTATGGLPGEDSRNEVVIYRGMFKDGEERDELVNQINRGTDVCSLRPDIPEDPHIVRIPLRFDPRTPPKFNQDDIILRTGDIVSIEARDTEVFYTGGVLPGQQLPLPRDYDLDIIDAIALAGGSVGGPGTGIGNLGRGGQLQAIRSINVGVAPSLCYVIRKTPAGGQIPIRVNLKKALVDPNERLLIKSGDFLVLQFTFTEELENAVLGVLSINEALNFTQIKTF